MNTIRPSVLTLLLLILATSTSALANDSEASLVGGSIVLKKSTSISMEEEELTITPDEVRVRYRFRNHSTSDVATQVAFPIRALVMPDEVGDVAGFVQDMRFTVAVEGVAVAVEHTVRQTEDSIEVMFHWPMTFPAGRTITVTHQYETRGGYILPDGPGYAEFWKRFSRETCIGSALLKKIRRKPLSAQTVDYVLSTGANWRGPIRKFRLVVETDEDGQAIATCMKGLKKSGRSRYVLDRKNFTPSRELSVTFVNIGRGDR
ncbi:MAG TPA: DUF4424 family protein [Candidatus Kapabacteria bacterium]|nr:DUF4424 family protein [Candidatus Kapabacteria bacterium]